MFSEAEELKFHLLADGVQLTPAAYAYIATRNRSTSLTPADYASTSGVILELEDEVWVNAPIAEHNPNFVDAPACTLDVADGALVVTGHGKRSRAWFWLPPALHDETTPSGETYTSYGFVHTDRLRISPIEGCAFTCKFCDLPYEFRYRTKTIEGLIETVERALVDPVQPAAHILLSGGTPRPDDYGYLKDCYAAILERFSTVGVDIMMVPMPELIDVEELDRLGVDGLSLNVEIHNRELARSLMRRKHDHGLDPYLEFIRHAADRLGPGRVRSMLVVGIEPLEDTLAGVRAIAERGAVPVLSPFRPDPSTPLRSWAPPTAAQLREAYVRSLEITRDLGVPLGPRCVPCSHNTLTFSAVGAGDADHHHGRPNVV